MKKLSALILAILMLVSMMAGCVENADPTTKPGVNTTNPKPTTPGGDPIDPTNPSVPSYVIEEFPEGDYIWKTAVSVMAANWNPHTYQTTDDSVPLDYTTSSLYTFIFNDELHPVEGKDAYAGYYIMPDMALEEPIDVTAEIKAAYPQFNIPADIDAGYAYKIILNPDVCWDDGTPINAQTYVDSFVRLLDPKLLNYRAADWYGQTLSIAGAENYFNQGKTLWNAADSVHAHYSTDLDSQLVFYLGPTDEMYSGQASFRDAFGFPASYTTAMTIAYLTKNDLAETPFTAEIAEQMQGKTLAEIKADEAMKAAWDTLIGWWQTDPDEELDFFVVEKSYAPNFSFDNVGVMATGEYELTLVLDKSLAGFDLLYSMTSVSTVLVKADLYDANLKCETGASGEEIWSSTYNTSVETTVSFGPYKMSYFQTDKAMHFVRNENWWGYTDGKHIYMDPVDGLVYQMYQTTEIDIQVVAEAETRKNMFFAGQLMGYGLQADDFATLRNSEWCYASPGSTIFFLILNGHMESIQKRENAEGFDKATQDLEMLTNTAFHMAVGMSYDKDDFASTISPARSGALGIIGDAYIYDPDTGARYRDTDQAKQVLCDFYGVDINNYGGDLDKAVNAITGYNPEQAKVLFRQAFAEGIEAGYINDANNDGICDQMIRIEYVMSSDPSEFMTKTIKYLNDNIALATKDTPFEGKIEFFMGPNVGNEWSNMIREGMSDTVLGGWSGSLLDPFGLTDLYTNPSKQYDAKWYDATKVQLTINVPVNGVNKDVTLSLKQWSDALNGTAVEVDGVTYNFGSGQADVEVRLNILAACEGKILQSYNYLPMLLDGSMALLSQQVYYVVEEYNPILGRGGIAYTKYNHNEAEWAAEIEKNGGTLKY